MSEWISRVCAKQKTFYVPPLSHSKSSQKSNKAINRTNSYKNVLVVVVLCIIYPNTPLTMSIFFLGFGGKKKFKMCILESYDTAIYYCLQEEKGFLIWWIFCQKDLLVTYIGRPVTDLDIIWKRIDYFFLVMFLKLIVCFSLFESKLTFERTVMFLQICTWP